MVYCCQVKQQIQNPKKENSNSNFLFEMTRQLMQKGIYLASPLRRDMKQGLFFKSGTQYTCVWTKDKNCKVPATPVLLLLTPPNLVQWGRCCCKVGIPRTRCLLPFKIKREQIPCFDLSQKTKERCIPYKNLKKEKLAKLKYRFRNVPLLTSRGAKLPVADLNRISFMQI